MCEFSINQYENYIEPSELRLELTKAGYREILSPISYNLSEAHEELESQLDRFIEAIEEYNSEKDLAIAEVERSSTLNHLLQEF